MVGFSLCRLGLVARIVLVICLTLAVRAKSEPIGRSTDPIDLSQLPLPPCGPVHSGGGLERFCELPSSLMEKLRSGAPTTFHSSPALAGSTDAQSQASRFSIFPNGAEPMSFGFGSPVRPLCLRI
jgi:hypothetical protein